MTLPFSFTSLWHCFLLIGIAIVKMTDEKEHRLQGENNVNYFVLDAPEGQARVAELVCDQHEDFLAADLMQQAAMIRFIRAELAQEHSDGFVDVHGDTLDDDAINLGIAKVIYQNAATHSHGNGIPAMAAAAAAMKPPSSRRSGGGGRNAQGDTVASLDDGAIYEYLNNLRTKPTTNGNRISPSSSSSSAAAGASTTTNASTKRKAKKSSWTSQLASKRAHTSTKVKKASGRAKSYHGSSLAHNGDYDDEEQEPSISIAAFPSPEHVHARAAALLAETQASQAIPKGVTVRPSGRWQSQVYYKGQSRYLGVYTDSSEAAMAWHVAKKLLSQVDVIGATKTETDKWFTMVKDIVTDLVQGARETTSCV